MPNYSLVTPTQRVISFEDIVKPYQMLQTEIDKQDAAVAQLLAQVGDWEKLKGDPNSKKAYDSYKDYETKLRDLANDIADNGLRNNAKSRVLNLAAQYSGTINPIKEAWDRRNKLIENQYKLGPNAINEFDASQLGIDQLMANPSLTPRYLDRNYLYTKASHVFGTLANDLREAMSKGTNDPYLNMFVQKYGASPQEVSDFMAAASAGDINSAIAKYPALGRMFEGLYNETGVNSWNNPEASRQVQDAILSGAWSAIGKSSATTYADAEAAAALKDKYDAISDARSHRYAVALENLRHQNDLETAALKNSGTADSSGIPNYSETTTDLLGLLGVGDPGSTGLRSARPINIQGVKNPVNFFNPSKNNGNNMGNFGRIKTREEFIKQGTTSAEKKLLGDYYDGIKAAGQATGIWQNNTNPTRIGDVRDRRVIDNSFTQDAMALGTMSGYTSGNTRPMDAKINNRNIIGKDRTIDINLFKVNGKIQNPLASSTVGDNLQKVRLLNATGQHSPINIFNSYSILKNNASLVENRTAIKALFKNLGLSEKSSPHDIQVAINKYNQQVRSGKAPAFVLGTEPISLSMTEVRPDIKNTIEANLKALDDNGKLDAHVFKINSDGTKGRGISHIGNILKKDGQDYSLEVSGRNLGISHLNPGYVIVRTKSGTQFLVDYETLGIPPSPNFSEQAIQKLLKSNDYDAVNKVTRGEALKVQGFFNSDTPVQGNTSNEYWGIK